MAIYYGSKSVIKMQWPGLKREEKAQLASACQYHWVWVFFILATIGLRFAVFSLDMMTFSHWFFLPAAKMQNQYNQAAKSLDTEIAW